jgi:hypothetical protein
MTDVQNREKEFMTDIKNGDQIEMQKPNLEIFHLVLNSCSLSLRKKAMTVPTSSPSGSSFVEDATLTSVSMGELGNFDMRDIYKAKLEFYIYMIAFAIIISCLLRNEAEKRKKLNLWLSILTKTLIKVPTLIAFRFF